MTASEILSKIATHQVKGIMFHAQMADYFDFLNLRGFKRLHEYQYMSESAEYRKTCRFCINHCYKLCKIGQTDDPHIIPDRWYSARRSEVDTNTKRRAVVEAFEQYVLWEQNTLQLYEQCYSELVAEGKIAIADYVKNLIADVADELKNASRLHMELANTDGDIIHVYDLQEAIHEDYKQKTRVVGSILS